ncbi:glycosyltransferase family 39 protein [Klenkia taihuensis]|uniref:4-amino-4-deoxy-L-arabinose transferase n=1 Tax=Klenkia taihuensis TaxID=1225127 RepID=A0A1I1MCM6_9ACTN|nr:glycosyltransferase family 39 protein [Klenkia taihuensis]GHE14099.1 glycosyl transferase [Klenkia taihuensis]SFC80848.1 4-amino-4-deoxy-L-arabinose transferase [Klenkia taihuensis]
MSTLLDRPVAAPPPAGEPAPAGPRGERGRAATLLLGPAGDPRWVRPSLVTLLAATGVLYVWDLAASGWANAFYAAAAQAGSQSWEAFFYGSSDAANSITVDKPPASLWVMDLSVRVFGLNSWSLLVPQALMGTATVGVVYLAVRRVAGAGAGLLAGAVTTTTPVAVLMSRFDNPDALLVLLLTLAAYLMVRALQSGRRATLVGVGVLVGFAFLTKTLQALLVVPGFALVWLVCAPSTFRRRLVDLLLAGAAVVAAGGWWVAVVELVPAGSRPFIGGSQTNSVWELIWGYNGLGRLTGDETGSVGGGGGWGETGLGRLFGYDVGGQVAWLLPAALVLGAAGLVVLGRAARTDVRRSGLLVWASWLVVTGLVFSLMAGIFHAYYTVALAPAIGAVVGTGGALLWSRRRHPAARLVLAATAAGTGWWASDLLGRTPWFLPWLAPTVLAAGLVAGAGLLAVHVLPRLLAGLVATAAVLAALGGPVAFALQTAATPHTGSIVTAGPDAATRFGPARTAPTGGGFSLGTPPPTATAGTATTSAPTARGGSGQLSTRGNLLGASDPTERVVAALRSNASAYTWVAAAVGSQSAAGFQLATGDPVMAVGGFNGSDPSPTLAQFQQYVAEGQIHWFVGGTVGRSSGGSDASIQIAQWVAAHYSATTVDGIQLYDLTPPTG